MYIKGELDKHILQTVEKRMPVPVRYNYDTIRRSGAKVWFNTTSLYFKILNLAICLRMAVIESEEFLIWLYGRISFYIFNSPTCGIEMSVLKKQNLKLQVNHEGTMARRITKVCRNTYFVKAPVLKPIAASISHENMDTMNIRCPRPAISFGPK